MSFTVIAGLSTNATTSPPSTTEVSLDPSFLIKFLASILLFFTLPYRCHPVVTIKPHRYRLHRYHITSKPLNLPNPTLPPKQMSRTSNTSSTMSESEYLTQFLRVSVLTPRFLCSFPNNVEDYVHRIGRTGRAGAKGVSYTYFTTDNAKQARDLIGLLREAGSTM
jgi:hypothetical protein